MNDVTKDIWVRWRQTTRARIGLGRSGDALPTSALLEFQAAHGRARDAVHGAADFAALAEHLTPLPCLAVHSQAPDRATYLRRPDLGRRLDESSVAMLKDHAGDWDIAFVIADGLSARAVMTHAVPVLQRCMVGLAGWRIAPIILASQARVALGDHIATCLNAKAAAVLIGERPGLSVADSLGVYLTWAPQVGRADSERNCISNIHADGMSHDQAAATLLWLLHEARRLRLSGIGLKLDPAGVAALLPTST
ncbi:MAG: ethanolamine ammonia-lyase subunit EutC [Ferrovibrio sp.]|uniref:ethanolamine ammonia-lyase subunit EutC n=1 Tax=Ferrovibrio sp. TaxID=1917215 RepID=UPI00391C74D0